ncbi:hypothetical protein HGI15_22255, partial [Modestobacter lapidis]|nr:hypothetical protein [Modestobacter lapidis]
MSIITRSNGQVYPVLRFHLHKDDAQALQAIIDYFGVGTLNYTNNSVSLTYNNIPCIIDNIFSI